MALRINCFAIGEAHFVGWLSFAGRAQFALQIGKTQLRRGLGGLVGGFYEV